jgi:hypothetical protein
LRFFLLSSAPFFNSPAIQGVHAIL